MDGHHPLLRRQLLRHMPDGAASAPEWQEFLRVVSEAYGEFDFARRLVERALELSSTELHAANAELRGVLEIMPDLLFRVCSDGRISGVIESNAILNHPLVARLADRSTEKECPRTAAFWRAVRNVRESRSAERLELDCETEHGTIAYELRLLPFVGEDLIGIARDIAERRQAEQDRLILGKLESTGILAGGIAHDFNNLLTAMLLNVQGARHAGFEPAEVDRCFRETERCVFAAQALTQQLLAFARGGAANWQLIVLRSVIEDAVPVTLSGSNVRGHLTIAPNLWVVNADPAQIGQLIRNLVLNAREAMPGGGEVAVTVENKTLTARQVGSLPAGDYVHITVVDHGPGIPADVLPKIFDPYFSTKTRGAQKGMGLGLTICHSIVKRHGGAILGESSVGVGSTFHVYLPACAREMAKAEVAPPPNVAKRAGRVLVMDDEPMIRTAFKHVLAHLGFEAEVVADGSEALERYSAASAAGKGFDAVMLDLTVRGEMGGIETMRALRERDPAVCGIVMSGYNGDQVMRSYTEHGFKAALAKPCTESAVQTALQQALANSR